MDHILEIICTQFVDYDKITLWWLSLCCKTTAKFRPLLPTGFAIVAEVLMHEIEAIMYHYNSTKTITYCIRHYDPFIRATLPCNDHIYKNIFDPLEYALKKFDFKRFNHLAKHYNIDKIDIPIDFVPPVEYRLHNIELASSFIFEVVGQKYPLRNYVGKLKKPVKSYIYNDWDHYLSLYVGKNPILAAFNISIERVIAGAKNFISKFDKKWENNVYIELQFACARIKRPDIFTMIIDKSSICEHMIDTRF